MSFEIGGDLPDVEASLAYNGLRPTAAAFNVQGTPSVRENGGVHWNPLRSDQTRTLHEFSQVGRPYSENMAGSKEIVDCV